jgi:two-component system chemotaxis response regulator CheY
MDSFNNITACEAANGNDAIIEYDRLSPDIVLMDIVMPGLEGVETVRRICKANPEARIIMVSSVSNQEKIDEAMAAGARYFVAKPVTTEELRIAIEKALGE